MNRSISAILILVLGAMSSQCLAGPHGDLLSKCIVEKTSKEDRAAIVVWMFAALTKNSGLASLSVISDESRVAINKAGGAVFQKALAEVCLEESKTAYKLEGQSAVGEGFRGLGELAMTEMFADPAVDKELNQIITYIDINMLVPIFLESGPATKNEAQP